MPEPGAWGSLAATVHSLFGPRLTGVTGRDFVAWQVDLGVLAPTAHRHWRTRVTSDGAGTFSVIVQHSTSAAPTEWITNNTDTITLPTFATDVFVFTSLLAAAILAMLPSVTALTSTLDPDGTPQAISYGGCPVTLSTDSTPEPAIYGCTQLWLDAAGAYRRTHFYATSVVGAQRIANAIQDLSNALAVSTWIGPVAQITGTALTDPYPFVQDELRVAVIFPGVPGGEPLTIPAPLGGQLLANQVTFDPSSSGWNTLKSACVGNLWSANAAATATDLLTGLRGAEAQGGNL